MSEIVCSFDIETAGRNVHTNPILQIGAVVMELVKSSGEIKIHDIFDVCIKMNTDVTEKRSKIIKKYAAKICMLTKDDNQHEKVVDLCYKMNIELNGLGRMENFEKRCIQEFWGQHKTLLSEILKNGTDKTHAYNTLHDFLLEVRKNFNNVTNISDNKSYDLARVSSELQKYNYNSLEWIGETYNEFGLDTEDFIKGISFIKEWSLDECKEMVKLDDEFKEIVERHKELIKKKTKVSFKPHSAVYDAIKIGLEYLLVKKKRAFFLARQNAQKK
jgi:hypothetical protein